MAHIGFWGDGGVSRDQGGNERSEEGFSASAGVVNELKEAEIDGQFLLRDAAVRTQPGAEQRPEALQGIDVNFAEAVAIVIAGILTPGMADRFVTIAPVFQAGIDNPGQSGEAYKVLSQDRHHAVGYVCPSIC